MNIGGRIRAARRARGWSQVRLAAAAGLGADTVQRIEHRCATARLDTLVAILDALELPACSFFGPPCEVGVLQRRAVEVQAQAHGVAKEADVLRRDIERVAARRKSRAGDGPRDKEVA